MKRSLPVVLALLALSALSARADIIPGLEVFGDVTLVDSIDCAADTAHRFRDYPAGHSYVTNILGSSARAMAHLKKSETSGGKQSGSYISWRIGEGKGIVPNEPYVMVVDYPDDAPRSVTLVNFGIGSRHGYHTGFTVGESMSPVVAVPQSQESVNVPLSGEWKQLVEVLFPFERTVQYDGTGEENKLTTATDGFDIDFVLLPWEQATDSLGVAVRAIRLYRINDYAAAKPTINYPAGDVPRRVITFREEMADDDGLASYATPTDFYVGKAKQMSLLGINTMSRDLLEFGYMQYWSGDSRWSWAANYWPATIDAMTAEGHYILPYYEYAGSRGPSGIGVNDEYRPMTLSADTQSNKYLFSNQDYVYKCLADLTLPVTQEDLEDLMDKTIFRYTDRGNFLGAWIRSRGQMPIGFGDKTIALFNQETGRAAAGTAVTRADIYNNGSYSDTALYKEYRAWWYGKRHDLFQHMRDYLVQKGLDNPKFFYHGCIAEGGESWNDGQGNRVLAWQTTDDNKFQGKDWCEFTGKSVNRYEQWHSQLYKQLALDKDFPTWNNAYEIGHSCPADDYYNYTNATGFGLSYPFNCVYTVLEGAQVGNYRNASGDLFLVRHYSLNEFCGQDQNLPEGQRAITGYFISDMDHAGRAVMISELRAMATWDPNMFGYMFGSEVDRLDATYVREFNLNYLSLPATRSDVLSGGGWGHDITVRKWTTPAGEYWAVINTGYKPFEGNLDFHTSATKVYRTVDGGEIPLSGGKAHLAMEPLQMIAFTSVSPDGASFSVTTSSIGDTSATISANVLTLGPEASSGTITITYGTSSDYSGTLSASSGAPTSGTVDIPLSGLTPLTTYYALVTLVPNVGDPATVRVSFTTGVSAESPVATLSASASANAATLSVDLSSLGEGASRCDLYAVFTPSAPGLATVSRALGSRTETGPCSFVVSPLSSEAVYEVELFGTNDIPEGGRLAATSITTLAKPAVPLGAGALAEGLIQAKVWTDAKTSMNKTFDILSTEGATRVPGAAMAGVTANASTYATQCYQNPYDGQKFYYSKFDTTFGYAGEMFFEAGKTYTIGKSYDDGVLVRIDGADILDHQQYSSTTTKTYTPSSTGWKPIEIRLWDGDGGKGPKNGWSSFTGVAYNTTGFTTISAETTDSWTPFMADADAPLRCRSTIPGLATIGTVARSGSTLVVPVSVDSYDEDNVLTVYATTAAPAAGEFSEPSAIPHDFSGWTSAAGATPAIGPGQSQNVSVSGLSLAPGATVYAVARLVNARTGYDVVSPVATYVVPADDSAPEFTASLSEAGYRDAAFAINVTSVGSGAATVTVAVQIGSKTYTAASGATGYNAVYRTPYELDYGTDYTATITVSNNRDKSTTQTVSFSTLARVAPAATLAVGAVGFTDAAFTVNVTELGTDPGTGSVLVEVLSGSTVVWSKTEALSATGTKAFSATGLADGTAHTVRATVTTAAGTVSLGPTAFSTIAFGDPVFGTCAAQDVAWGSATLSVALSALGAGSDSATVAWTLSGGAATPSSGTLSFPQAETRTVSVSGLAPETAYTATLVATGLNGRTAQTAVTFTTSRYPIALGDPVGTCSGTGTNATAKVAVAIADVAATLTLSVDGATVQTWTGVSADAEYAASFPISVGATKSYAFALSADGCTNVVKTGQITGRQVVDWFNVPLADAAYASWALASGADPYEPTARWTLSGAQNASAVGTDGSGARAIALATGSDGAVSYAPAFPSESGRTLEISGTATLLAHPAAPPVPEDAPIAGLAVGTANGAPVLYGWGAAGWTALSGGAVTTNAPVAWKATLDFGAGTIAYSLGGVAFSPNAALPAGAGSATRVAFRGSGAIGAFRGVYADSNGGSVTLYQASIRIDGSGLEFKTPSGQTEEKFVIGLKDTVKDRWYAVFAANSLDTDEADWVCVACKQEETDDGIEDLPCSTVDATTGEPIPAQFFKIFGASKEISIGTAFGDL